MRRVRRPVLAECGESARQAASKESYPILERAVRAFGSTQAPQSSRPNRRTANHRDQVTAAYLDGRYFARTRSLSREGAIPMTSALTPTRSLGNPLLLLKAADSRSGPSRPSVPRVRSRESP